MRARAAPKLDDLAASATTTTAAASPSHGHRFDGMGDDEFGDEFDDEQDEYEQPYNDEPPPPGLGALQLEAPAGFAQHVAPDVNGIHDEDRLEERQPLEEAANDLLQPQAGFSHYQPPPEYEQRATHEDMRSATPPRTIAMEHLGESTAVDSPATPLGQSIGAHSIGGQSSVGEELDVNTEALIEETIERLSFVHGVQVRVAAAALGCGRDRGGWVGTGQRAAGRRRCGRGARGGR